MLQERSPQIEINRTELCLSPISEKTTLVEKTLPWKRTDDVLQRSHTLPTISSADKPQYRCYPSSCFSTSSEEHQLGGDRSQHGQLLKRQDVDLRKSFDCNRSNSLVDSMGNIAQCDENPIDEKTSFNSVFNECYMDGDSSFQVQPSAYCEMVDSTQSASWVEYRTIIFQPVVVRWTFFYLSSMKHKNLSC